ncbi:peptide maturation protein PmbA [Legionella geestiana]|uniref:Peptide maturation protein PmbA n=1 Tax=Legionella geestiana TaxID=45065 RepID=A0A0W0TXH2_9GAMM|nr:metalloprotease PmbA [Legionella geestiana]KTD00173.1 peptide maturation protein PmbA [Legionella geestiana]STX53524.1 peptide maturation protein PmbA [Legionella geestiana]
MENTNRAHSKSTEDMLSILEDVLARAKARGASDASVSVHDDCGFSVDVRMGEVETVAFNEDRGISLTAYVGHRKGTASSTDLDSRGIDVLVEAAMGIASVSAADPCFGLPEPHLMQKEWQDLDLYHPWSLTPAEAIEYARDCESKALSQDARIFNSDGVHLSTGGGISGFANTAGGRGVLRFTRHSLSCSLLAREGDSVQRDYAYTTARHPGDMRSLETVALEAASRTTARLGARQIGTRMAPVLFAPRISGGLLSSFINAISGSTLYRKNSFLQHALDTRVFPAGVIIHEQPALLRGLGSSPFDDEGVPTRANRFVEDGILRLFALGSYSARKMNLQTTANAGGVHNLTADGGEYDLNALVKRMGTGLLVTELMGSGVNILTGDYSRGAGGFWVENGEIAYPVEQITIAGNLREMFLGIEAIGNDINPDSSTRCGSVLINRMTVAGHG